MVQLYLCKCPSWMRSQLLGGTEPASLLRPCFIEPSPTVGKAYHARKPIASLPSFHNVHRLQYANFMLQTNSAANETMDRHVQKLCCLMLWCLKHIRMIAAMYVTSADLLLVHYARILDGGQQHRELQKTTNCQNWRVGTCAGMGDWPGQYCSYIVGISVTAERTILVHKVPHLQPEICFCGGDLKQ